MPTIEHFIQEWASQKRQTLSMTEQESVRIWNSVLLKLESEPVSVVVAQPTGVSVWLHSLVRLSIIPH